MSLRRSGDRQTAPKEPVLMHSQVGLHPCDHAGDGASKAEIISHDIQHRVGKVCVGDGKPARNRE